MKPPNIKEILLAAALLTGPAAAQTSAQPQFPPLQVGESVRLKVNFQSCRSARTPGQQICVLYSGARKYFAAKDAATRVATFRTLADSVPGTPMVVEGIVEQAFGGTAGIRLSSVSGRVAESQDRVLQRLQGDWISEADPNDEFTITGSERDGYYAGLGILAESISVQDSCGGVSVRPPYLYAHDQEGGVGLCYEIVSASADELLLSYLPRGNRLRYLRKK